MTRVVRIARAAQRVPEVTTRPLPRAIRVARVAPPTQPDGARRAIRVAVPPRRFVAPHGAAWFLADETRWQCVYGCKAFPASRAPADDQYHTYTCPYWWEEGIDDTPF